MDLFWLDGWHLCILISSLFWIGRAIEAMVKINGVLHLSDLPAFCENPLVSSGHFESQGTVPKKPPMVSVIIAAKDEETRIREATRSQVSQTYENLEVIAVDDRSTDRTAEILREEQEKSARLHVIHVKDLPSGWLGKTHAQWVGASHARGQWLLFVDGDIVYDATVVTRAVGYAEKVNLDHLVVLPKMEIRDWGERAFLACLCTLLCTFYRPWKVRDRRSSETIGTGAFQMIRRSAYDAVGTHQALALTVIDDIGLAQAVKRKGLKQECVFGGDLIHVRWQEGVWGIVKGVEKNMFSMVHFNLALLLLAIVMTAVGNLSPFVGLVWARGVWQCLSAAALLSLGVLYYLNQEASEAPFWMAVFHPLSVLVLLFAAVRSATLALWRGGVIWRGTFYPLSVLRAWSVPAKVKSQDKSRGG